MEPSKHLQKGLISSSYSCRKYQRGQHFCRLVKGQRSERLCQKPGRDKVVANSSLALPHMTLEALLTKFKKPSCKHTRKRSETLVPDTALARTVSLLSQTLHIATLVRPSFAAGGAVLHLAILNHVTEIEHMISPFLVSWLKKITVRQLLGTSKMELEKGPFG